jgi:hypothetical protein
VAGTDGEGVSAEAVKAAIRQLIDAEDPRAILSDDALVDLLKRAGSIWRGARWPSTARRSGWAVRSSGGGKRPWPGEIAEVNLSAGFR